MSLQNTNTGWVGYLPASYSTATSVWLAPDPTSHNKRTEARRLGELRKKQSKRD